MGRRNKKVFPNVPIVVPATFLFDDFELWESQIRIYKTLVWNPSLLEVLPGEACLV